MVKLRVRLTLIIIALLAVTALGAGFFTVDKLKDSQLQFLKDQLLQEIKVIQNTLTWRNTVDDQEIVAYFSEGAEELSKSTQARITFIDLEGNVVGESDFDPEQMDNHLFREEILSIIDNGEYGTAIRYSNTINHNMLYVAAPFNNNNNPIGYLRLAINLDEVEYKTNELWTYYIIGILFLLIITAVISFLITRGLTKPLENIMMVAQQITRGNYQSKVKIYNKDEIGQLGKAINKMASSLQYQMNRISENEIRLKTVLEHLISGVIMIDRHGKIVLLNRASENILGIKENEILGKRYNDTKQNQELITLIQTCLQKKQHIREELTFYYPEQRTLEMNLVPLHQDHRQWSGILIVMHDITAIRKLEKMRSDFAANVSHELKTPIAAVKGFSETLLSGALDDRETAKSFLQIIYDESDRLNRLISDILELSKIESKAIPLNYSPLAMHPFVQKTVQMLESQSNEKQIHIALNVNQDLYMEADEDRLRQVFINLLSNAINYTPESGHIEVQVEYLNLSEDVNDEKVRIKISDTGIGIPKKDLPRIFERFYRVDKARSRSSGGTGLGLSIVKHIVELHKGEIKVESDVGSGTTFIIDLPLVQ
ncbi:two-component system histidine kinase PnpS [Chengkuizengella sediminis]|uniref:two-component system histidine kinase PnpS n=1 Tax=Chengkuizengella sediminis TaxID=1885917 RepID=UPI00138A1884|nr:ATP-binding protein [Chengkuizengella sediminis]NDI36323.1 cell wall metabolism sensor histidine kinase WalK [Chengkuizengella sediminis]